VPAWWGGVGAVFVSGPGFDSGAAALAVVLGSGADFAVGAAPGLGSLLGSGRAGGVDGAGGAGISIESLLSVADLSPADFSLVDFSLDGLSASGLSIIDGVVDVDGDGSSGDFVVEAERGGGAGFIQSST
jgi:hypothetical protein